ncbi:MAG: HDOD domain-containing protein [Gammaproteobacteria bacterium]|nr:HDOD domain-containing protein [Gammaproteobacteria bacterium]
MIPQQQAQDLHFSFVQSLASNLSAGSIELPSFPKAVLRLRQVLEDENSTTAQIVQLLSVEPALSARLIQIANSAAMGGANQITDLNTVVNRMGRQMVQSAAMSYAMKQMRESQTLDVSQVLLDDLWHTSTQVAALCYVLAKKYTKLNRDQALMVGLMHGIGKLYILGQAQNHPELFSDPGAMEGILQEWHAGIGSAILQTWNFPDNMSYAVANFEQTDRVHEDGADFTDVLILSFMLAHFLTAGEDGELQLDDVPAAVKLGVSAHDLMELLIEFEEQIASLRHALG